MPLLQQPGMPSPPQPPQQPMASGAGVSGSPNLGNQAAALTSIRHGVELLQKAMVAVPPGSELHTNLLETIKRLSKTLIEAGPASPAAEANSHVQAIKQNQAQAQQVAAMRAMLSQQQQGAPAGMGAPPEQPPQPQQMN